MVSNVQNKRRQKDVNKIMMSGYDVEILDENRMDEFVVKFKGPPDSPYAMVSVFKHHSFRANGE